MGFKTSNSARGDEHAGEHDSPLDLEKISDPGPDRLFPGKQIGCQERPRDHGFNLTQPRRKVSSETRPSGLWSSRFSVDLVVAEILRRVCGRRPAQGDIRLFG